MSIHQGWRPMVAISNSGENAIDFAFPEPSTYEANTATIVDSARNAAGYVIGNVIRDDVGKISMSWKFISANDWANILKQFSPKYGGSLYNWVTFYNQDENDWDRRQLYVSDREASVFMRTPDGSIKGYTNASLSLIEV